MPYYHYTSLSAFNGILQSNPSIGKELCFWATRYDCFLDKEEYLLGIDYLARYLSIFEQEYNLLKDRRIAQEFKRSLIDKNVGLPHPYIISVTAHKDNAYMWKNYADNNNGVVLEIEIPAKSGGYDNAILYQLEKCIYEGLIDEKEILKIVSNTYVKAGYILLQNGREKALSLLASNPQFFVRLIAIYMLAFFAPRIKGQTFYNEEETRIILSAPIQEYTQFMLKHSSSIDRISEIFESGLKAEDIANTILQEKSRNRENKKVFYREFYLPKASLQRVFILNKNTESKVREFLNQKNFPRVGICDISDHKLK
ncbi:DUF2971 domain-containing protein [Parabacteroides bouchesdurhonensis]|uniref:DUF2971 domain-containing protein n=1 Tax=Parabacteroides bouchesdurhonensis TaxID=1936995 RepID=UPI000E55316F|nr:DUF2971 domain-containing protein [Parabacteroides bouchesdurhonensis]RHJ94961.1 DUF2971 domain-containing protein [Bacteroides sp. AM07-16]